MEFLLQTPNSSTAKASYPLWLVLHGAFDKAEQSLAMFGAEATEHDAFLLAPQATRPCGNGYCWSFARDAQAIRQLIEMTCATYQVDRTKLSMIGYSMGCAMGLWLIAQNPGVFPFFSALGIGSAFEPWEHDDGGIDEEGLAASAGFTRLLLAVDESDPVGTNTYFNDNLLRLRRLGLHVETFRPNLGTHAVTDPMKAAVLQAILK